MFHVEHRKIKMIKTVIFDFNGTLYLDQDLNKDAWLEIYEEIIGNKNGFEEKLENILATKDSANVDNFFKMKGLSVKQEILDEYAYKKESIYQKLAMERNRKELTPGAKELLDYLKDKEYKLILCTASIKYNVDFYFDYCGLSKWFDYSLTVYDDGINKNKYEMYKKALELADCNIDDCLAFDDSCGSINSALRAGLKKIVRINHYRYQKVDDACIIQELADFKNLDYSLFEK